MSFPTKNVILIFVARQPCPLKMVMLPHKWFLAVFFRKCDANQQKVHKVGKQNFSRETFIENEVKMNKIVFLQKIIGRDI